MSLKLSRQGDVSQLGTVYPGELELLFVWTSSISSYLRPDSRSVAVHASDQSPILRRKFIRISERPMSYRDGEGAWKILHRVHCSYYVCGRAVQVNQPMIGYMDRMVSCRSTICCGLRRRNRSSKSIFICTYCNPPSRRGRITEDI